MVVVVVTVVVMVMVMVDNGGSSMGRTVLNADPMDKWDGTNASVCRKCRGGEGDDASTHRSSCYEECRTRWRGSGTREKRDFATPLRGLTFLLEHNFCLSESFLVNCQYL